MHKVKGICTVNQSNSAAIGQIFELIKQTTSTIVVKDFLKSKKLPYSSGSWVELFDKRILPAFEEGKLTIDSLKELLIDSEESGRQHILLFESSQAKAAKILDKKNLIKNLKSLSLLSVFENSVVLDLPEKPTIVDVRYESTNLIVKIVEAKETLISVGVQESGQFLTKKFKRILERAVHVFKLHADGMLEVRIASKSTGSRGYLQEVKRLGSYVSKIIPVDSFRALSLSRAKDNIWENRDSLSEKIRYSDATLKDDFGYSLKASSNSKVADLSDNKAVVTSMDSFSGKNTFCESNNIFFIPQESLGIPTKEIHVLISGEINEFAITANCEKADYDYVLNEIRKLNTRLP